ncbi:MAG TPA: hypothetical protein EYN66_03590, partial [Myxococcales bacterium]|nr:hypothetical protein [Myxococcales bacterium]
LAIAMPLFVTACATTEVTKTEVTHKGINIKGSVNFTSGSAMIAAESHNLLNDVAKAMKAHPDIGVIQIQGHTDDQGASDANQTLSSRRAKAVRNYLIVQGVPGVSLQSKGYGESHPKVFGSSKKARSTNRRVDFVLVKPLTVAGRIDMGITIPMGDDATDASSSTSFAVGTSVNYNIMDSLSVQLDLLYSMSDFSLNADTSISLHRVEFPLSVRYKLWEMYGIVPRVGLGMNLAASVSAKADGPNVAPIASSFTTGMIVNLGAAIPMNFGDIDVDFRYKHGFSSVLEEADVSLLELLLLVGYTY